MEPLPLPSHIHYELLLQLLERQTMATVKHKSPIQEQVQQLIITLRKALAQQKRLEELCARNQIEVDFRWSMNLPVNSPDPANSPDPETKDCVNFRPE